MNKSVPDSLKCIKPYISRGAELDGLAKNPKMVHQRRAAYYCYMHALSMSIDLLKSITGEDSTQAQEFVMELMQKLEEDKVSLNITEATKSKDAETIKDNALKTFKNADDQLRAGTATEVTARRFRFAVNFFEVLRGMDMDAQVPKFDEMLRYAKHQAAKIIKAVNEGRPITPPGDESNDNGSKESTQSPQAYMVKSPTSFGYREDIPMDSTSIRSNEDFGKVSDTNEDGDISMRTSPVKAYIPQNDQSKRPEPAQQRPQSTHDTSKATQSFTNRAGSFLSSIVRAPSGPVIAEEESAVVVTTAVKFDDANVHDAWELSRSALRALETKELDMAKKYLQQALKKL